MEVTAVAAMRCQAAVTVIAAAVIREGLADTVPAGADMAVVTVAAMAAAMAAAIAVVSVAATAIAVATAIAAVGVVWVLVWATGRDTTVTALRTDIMTLTTPPIHTIIPMDTQVLIDPMGIIPVLVWA